MLSAPGAQTSRGNRNVSTAIDRPSDLPGATGRGALNPGKAPLTLRAGLRPQRWHLADAPGDSLGPRKRLEGQPKIHAGLLWRGLSLSAISHSSIAAGGVGCTFFSASLADFVGRGTCKRTCCSRGAVAAAPLGRKGPASFFGPGALAAIRPACPWRHISHCLVASVAVLRKMQPTQLQASETTNGIN